MPKPTLFSESSVAPDALAFLSEFPQTHFDGRDPKVKRAEFNAQRHKIFSALVAKLGYVCQLRLASGCGRSGIFNVDHLVPLSTNELNKQLRGVRAAPGRKVAAESLGSNYASNLVLACEECNNFKKHRLVRWEDVRWVVVRSGETSRGSSPVLNFSQIKRRYGAYASFALWGEAVDDAPLPFIERNLSRLRLDTAFVGLNATRDQMGDFRNFHHVGPGCRDWLVREALDGTGIYMTDIVKTDTNVDSSAVEVTEKDAGSLAEELSLVGVRQLIACGGATQRALRRYAEHFSGVKVIPCRHYAARGDVGQFLASVRSALLEAGRDK